MKHLDLFSGIGGFALAVDTVWHEEKNEHTFCDNDPFAQAVIRKHWPESVIHGDIKKLNGGGAGAVDLVTGGFPCQPFSAAGKRRGTEDDRHLWPEMFRVIRESTPRWIIGENVGGLLTWNNGMVLDEVFSDLEGEGYEVGAFVIPAAAVNAPHRRDRVWIVAHADRSADGGNSRKYAETCSKKRISKRNEVGKFGIADSLRDTTNISFADSNARRIRRHERSSAEKGAAARSDSAWNEPWIEVATRLCRVDDGLPRRLDRTHRLRGLGNAIVPQVAIEIMKAIKTIES